jgi:hypothetical protein
MMTDAEIEAFIRSFENCSLPRAEWTHQRHLIVALWYLTRRQEAQATQLIREGIQRYNLSQGNPTGYHETITLAWVAVVQRFLAARDRTQPVSDLAEELLTSCGTKDYLLRYYTEHILMSDKARHHWIPPDRGEIL